MKKLLTRIAVVALIATVALGIGYKSTSQEVLLSLAITFGTVSYHLIMRLLVGLMFDMFMKNRADCRKRWYQISQREMSLYRRLKVQRWKGKMPTYESELFDPKTHSWAEIAQAMCQAELVHETIVLLSFLPILAGIRFGAYPLFIITSVLAAMVDMMFVIIQRYNRPRILRLTEKFSKRTQISACSDRQSDV